MWEFFKRTLNKHSDRLYDLLAVVWLLICLTAFLEGNRFLGEYGEAITDRNERTIEKMRQLHPESD